MTLTGFLDFAGDAALTAIVLVVLAEYFGYAEAEARDRKVQREWFNKGEDVPEEEEVPRTLLPERLRRWGNATTKVAFVIFVVTTVAYWIVK